MAEHSSIEWTDATWNPITGCSIVSPGCTNCYAMKLAGSRLQNHPSRLGLTRPTKGGPVWTGEVRFNEAWLTQPVQWKRPKRIFVCAHADLFHEAVPDIWIDRVFAVMALAPRHTFQVLTKRSARMRAYLSDPLVSQRWATAEMSLGIASTAAKSLRNAAGILFSDAPLPNVWLGVSAEDQRRADERIPDLLATPSATRFLSAEPLLGALDIAWALSMPFDIAAGFLRRGRFSPGLETLQPLDQVIVGGENGDRPMHPDWARSLRDQCAATGTPFLFKQWGTWAPDSVAGPHLKFSDVDPGPELHGWPYDAAADSWRIGKKLAGRLLDGVEHNGMPA